VRRIARDNNVNISDIAGSGIGGRVTKDDILGFIGAGAAASAKPGPAAAPAPASTRQAPAPAPAAARPHEGPTTPAGPRVDIQPMSVMRKKIAEHMIMSRRTSAHVHSVFEVNFSRVAHVRDTKKAEYERADAKLTYLSFIIKAVAEALAAVPIVNASVDGDNIVYHKDVNIGIAVALDWGLIVPVIKHAEERNFLGLARAIQDAGERARGKKLTPDDVKDGTFTITNPGQFGAVTGTPIINPGQAAILALGSIKDAPWVVDGQLAVRKVCQLALSFDHRVLDGQQGSQFLADVGALLSDPGLALAF